MSFLFIRVALWCALGVVDFMRGRWVHSGAPWGSSGVVGVTRVRPGVRWVHPGAPWESLSSSGVVGFTLVCAGGRRNRLRSLDSLGSLGSLFCAVVVVGFIQGLWVHSCAL